MNDQKPLRIGIDCRMFSSAFTGIGRYTFELTRHLFKIDQVNEYVLFFNNPGYENFTSPNGRIKKILVNAKHYSISEQIKFLRKLQKEKLDLMHFTHFNAPLFYFRPSIVTIHDLTLSFFPGRKMTSPLHRAAYHLTLFSTVKKAKHIIAVSNYTKKDLQKLFHLPDKKISVIYEGVDEQFAHVPENPPQTIPKYILYTGVWRSHKNLPTLIRAFHLLKEKTDFAYKLVITGREDPNYPEIKQLTQEFHLENDIIFTGHVNEHELAALYSGAHAYVFPSLYEGFGLPPLEAMQCGTPVVAAKSSSIPEVCGTDNALFFDPYDANDLASKIHHICVDKDLRKNLIKNGLEHVKKFSWCKMAEETLNIYESLKK